LVLLGIVSLGIGRIRVYKIHPRGPA
jgi:hypothetical protein